MARRRKNIAKEKIVEAILGQNVIASFPDENPTSVHTLTDEIRKTKVYQKSGSLGRILTWNVKKFGTCLQQENTEQLKEVICVILQSANLIVLQEASNLDFSCLPCNSALKDNFVWQSDGGLSQDFKILVKTKKKKSIRIIKEGTCKLSKTLGSANVAPAPVITAKPVVKETLTTNVHDELDNAHKLIDKFLVDYIQSKDFQSDMNKNEKNNKMENEADERSVSSNLLDEKLNDTRSSNNVLENEEKSTSDEVIDFNINSDKNFIAPVTNNVKSSDVKVKTDASQKIKFDKFDKDNNRDNKIRNNDDIPVDNHPNNVEIEKNVIDNDIVKNVGKDTKNDVNDDQQSRNNENVNKPNKNHFNDVDNSNEDEKPKHENVEQSDNGNSQKQTKENSLNDSSLDLKLKMNRNNSGFADNTGKKKFRNSDKNNDKSENHHNKNVDINSRMRESFHEKTTKYSGDLEEKKNPENTINDATEILKNPKGFTEYIKIDADTTNKLSKFEHHLEDAKRFEPSINENMKNKDSVNFKKNTKKNQEQSEISYNSDSSEKGGTNKNNKFISRDEKVKENVKNREDQDIEFKESFAKSNDNNDINNKKNEHNVVSDNYLHSKDNKKENKETIRNDNLGASEVHKNNSAESQTETDIKESAELGDTPIVMMDEKNLAEENNNSDQNTNNPIAILKEIQQSIKQLKDASTISTIAKTDHVELEKVKQYSTENKDTSEPNLQEKQQADKEIRVEVNGRHNAYVNSLKSRLLKSKAKLEKLDVKNDQFETIDNQIRFIERELTQLDAPPKINEKLADGSDHKESEIVQSNDKDMLPEKMLPGKALNKSSSSIRPAFNDQFVLSDKNPLIADHTKGGYMGKLSADYVNRNEHSSGNENDKEQRFSKKIKTDDYSARNNEVNLEENVEKGFHQRIEQQGDPAQRPTFRRLDLDSDDMQKLIREIIIEEKYNGDRNMYNNNNENDGDNKEVIKNFITKTNRKNLEDKILGKLRDYESKFKRDTQFVKRTKIENPLLHSKSPLRKINQTFYHDFEVTKRNFEATMLADDIHYELLSITSDLNSGQPFLVINVRLPKMRNLQASCIEAIKLDVRVYNQDKRAVLIMGDFHVDKMSTEGPFNSFNLYQVLANLQINGENFHSPITYHNKDPITTVFGRRYDNILTNVNLNNLKVIGPEFPLSFDTLVLPLTLQRLYNNYITALYNTDGNEPDSIYDCIRAYQTNGETELENSVCKDSWVPSSFISDHLPLQLTVKKLVNGRYPPVEFKLGSWNIQGGTLKERLLDPVVKKKFVSVIKKHHVLIFNYFLPGDETLNLEDFPGDIIRLKQGEMTTDFSIYINNQIKDKPNTDDGNDSQMFVMKKKNNNNDVTVAGAGGGGGGGQTTTNLISTVGLFTPTLKVDGESFKGCFYTVQNVDGTMSTDFKTIIDAIDKDVKTRLGCDFKILLASLYLDGSFNLDKELYNNYKYINMNCQIVSSNQNKYKYNVPRSRDLTDYIIVLEKQSSIEFGDCTIGFPGDEIARGIEKLSDFEELSTHYPLSIVINDIDSG